MPVVATCVVILVWLAVNIWAQAFSEWIGAQAAAIELQWIATRDE